MPIHRAYITVQARLGDPGEHEPPLLVCVAIECTACGEQELVFGSCHLRTIAEALTSLVDKLPAELTDADETQVVDVDRRPAHPENN